MNWSRRSEICNDVGPITSFPPNLCHQSAATHLSHSGFRSRARRSKAKTDPWLLCWTISWSRIVKPLIHTNIHPDFRRVFPHVKISRLVDQLFLVLCDPLT